MEPTVEILRIGLKKLDLALHAQFHSSTSRLVREMGPELTGVPTELMDEWDTNIAEELDMGRDTHTTVLTAEMLKKDTERTRTTTYISASVRNMRLSPEPELVQAADQLLLVIGKTGRLSNASASNRTKQLSELLSDFKKPENAAYLERAGLTGAVETLERLNNEYLELSLQRTALQNARKERTSKEEVRKQSDEIYDRVILILQMTFLLTESQEMREAIERLAGYLNNYTKHINKVYKQSRSMRLRAKRAKKQKEEEEDDDE